MMKSAKFLVGALALAAALGGSVVGATAALAANPTAPASPIGLTAVPGNNMATLNWTTPVDGGSAILGYNVYEATSPGGENYSTPANGNVLVNGTSAIVTGLSNGKIFYFTVTAVNGVGNSPASNETWVIPGGTVPGVPSAVNAIPGDASATVSWTPPSNLGGSAITSYKVIAADSTQSSNAGQTCTWTTGPLSCVVTGLTNGDSYTFTVTATNAVGTGSASSPSNAVVPTSGSAKKEATSVTFALSTTSVVFGNEQAESFSVKVAANSGPAPTGRVFVMAQPCRTFGHYCPTASLELRMGFAAVIKLNSGSGSVMLAKRALEPGTYRLWAFYTGSTTDMSSTSASKVLVVTKDPHRK